VLQLLISVSVFNVFPTMCAHASLRKYESNPMHWSHHSTRHSGNRGCLDTDL